MLGSSGLTFFILAKNLSPTGQLTPQVVYGPIFLFTLIAYGTLGAREWLFVLWLAPLLVGFRHATVRAEREASTHGGSHGEPVVTDSVTHSMTLTKDGVRPVRDDVVEAMDDALEHLGGQVMHAMDPRRLVFFAAGGPSVWSVGIVPVRGPRNYTLLVTYGFSHILCPSEPREGIHHEYSLALAEGVDPSPWADALLRHMSRYVLTSGMDLGVGDVMPCYAPITCVAFQPEHHTMMPSTNLVGLIVADDPVVPAIETEHGTIQVRRLYGIDPRELDRAETWSGAAFSDEYRKRDPLLITDLHRSSAMDEPSFVSACASRAAQEGSSVPAIQSDVTWSEADGAIEVHLSGGASGAKLRDAVYGRLKFGRGLTVIPTRGSPIRFEPADAFALHITLQGLVVEGALKNMAFTRYLEHPQAAVLRYVGWSTARRRSSVTTAS